MTDHGSDHLHRLYLAYRGLCDHVREVHGIDAPGTAGQVEAVHQRAHAREGTPWHSDAWRLPEPSQETRP